MKLPADYTEIERQLAVIRACDELEKILTAEIVSLREQVKRDEEHYQAAMTMNEKHRKLWVEASAQLNRQELDAATGAAKMSEWQPIATASKDYYTAILLVDAEDTPLADRQVCVGWWSFGEWRDRGDIGCNGQEDYAPTHWMPLPKPPQ